MRVIEPNTFIVGAPKSGTTALARYLAGHPRAFFSKLKEPGWWASDFPNLARNNRLRSQHDYLRLFAAGASRAVVGEASTMYLCSQSAVPRIHAHNPRARFIVMLRDPAEVAQAYHMQKVLLFHENQRDFEAAWRLQDARARGVRVPLRCPEPIMLQYGAMASFGTQVRRLLDTVPRSSVLFIRFEDFRADPAPTYRAALAFLGLPDDGRSEFAPVGTSREHRWPWLARLYLAPPAPLREPLQRLRLHLMRERYAPIEALKARWYRTQPRAMLSLRFRAELAEFFAPEVRELERLLGWNLDAWLPRAAARAA